MKLLVQNNSEDKRRLFIHSQRYYQTALDLRNQLNSSNISTDPFDSTYHYNSLASCILTNLAFAIEIIFKAFPPFVSLDRKTANKTEDRTHDYAKLFSVLSLADRETITTIYCDNNQSFDNDLKSIKNLFIDSRYIHNDYEGIGYPVDVEMLFTKANKLYLALDETLREKYHLQ